MHAREDCSATMSRIAAIAVKPGVLTLTLAETTPKGTAVIAASEKIAPTSTSTVRSPLNGPGALCRNPRGQRPLGPFSLVRLPP